MSRIAHISAAGGGSGGVVTIIGDNTPTDDYPNPSDALNVVGLTMVWDGAAWDRWTGGVTQLGTWTVELGAATLAALETVTVLQGTSPWVVSGTVSQTFTGRDDTDNQAAVATGLQVVVDRNYIWDGSAWDRWTGAVQATQSGAWTVALDAGTLAALETITVLQGTSPWVVSGTVTITDGSGPVTVDGTVSLTGTGRDDTDNQAAVSTGLPTTVDRLYAWDSSGGNWDRVRINAAGELIVTTSGGTPTGRDDTDNQAPVSTGLATTVDRLYLYDGTDWDRARTAGSIGALQVGGPAAHDSAVAGNPVLIGGYATSDSGSLTDVTAGDIVRALYDLKGVAFIKEQRPRLRGIYFAGSGPHQIANGADAANGGRVWLVNTSSTVAVALRKVIYSVVSGTALVVLTFPRINVERMTFTGTPSGATLTPALRDSTDAANTGTMRTAATGMTITAGAVIKNFSTHTVLTAVGQSMPSEQRLDLAGHIDSRIILRQNQGVVVRQADAGTLADTRRFFLDFEWEEYDL